AKTKKSGGDIDAGLRRLIEIKSMSIMELAGAILGRAQLLEEMMRMYIVAKSTEYHNPREVEGTFGSLRLKFRDFYPEQVELLEALKTANEVRNELAHSTFLVSWFIEGL